MRRLWHVFMAPGESEQPLPIPESPWHAGRAARVPEEHWQQLLEFAHTVDDAGADELERASFLENEQARQWSADNSRALGDLLQRMIERLPAAPPLTPEVTDDILEPYSPAEHVRMVQAVQSVIAESLRLGQPFESWVD